MNQRNQLKIPEVNTSFF
uniref:Uncharacterized protein n=1 Tax=Romanomermis culicivorax TaxID=13658 RepID=A0A915HLN0_ROMCU